MNGLIQLLAVNCRRAGRSVLPVTDRVAGSKITLTERSSHPFSWLCHSRERHVLSRDSRDVYSLLLLYSLLGRETLRSFLPALLPRDLTPPTIMDQIEMIEMESRVR